LTREEYTSSELRLVVRDTANRRRAAPAAIRHGGLAVSRAASGMPPSDGFDAEHAVRKDRSRSGAASRDRAAVASAITFPAAPGVSCLSPAGHRVCAPRYQAPRRADWGAHGKDDLTRSEQKENFSER